MQLRLHINDTNDGSILAAELRRAAQMIDGHRLNDGFRRDLEGGYLTMSIEPKRYETCAEAERQLGFTLDWREEGDRFVGVMYGRPAAYVSRLQREGAKWPWAINDIG